MRLVEQLKGFPSNEKDVYGFDLRLELQTFEIQWCVVIDLAFWALFCSAYVF